MDHMGNAMLFFWEKQGGDYIILSPSIQSFPPLVGPHSAGFLSALVNNSLAFSKGRSRFKWWKTDNLMFHVFCLSLKLPQESFSSFSFDVPLFRWILNSSKSTVHTSDPWYDYAYIPILRASNIHRYETYVYIIYNIIDMSIKIATRCLFWPLDGWSFRSRVRRNPIVAGSVWVEMTFGRAKWGFKEVTTSRTDRLRCWWSCESFRIINIYYTVHREWIIFFLSDAWYV